MKKHFLIFGLTAGIFMQPVLAQKKTTSSKTPVKTTSVAKTNDAVPLDAAVRVGKLPNGFTYYIRKNVEPKTG